MPGTVTVTDPVTGIATDIPAENLPEYQRRGFQVEGDADRAQRIADEQAAADTSVGDTIMHEGLAGATLGASDVLGRAVGGEDFALERRREQQFHPTAGRVANVLGMVAPALLTDGASLGADAAEGAADAGRAIAEGADLARAGEGAATVADAAAPSVLGTFARATPVALVGRAGEATSAALGGGTLGRIAGGATEGALFGASSAIDDLAANQDPLTAENIAGHLSANMLLGGAIGGGLSSIGRLAELGLGKAGDALRAAGDARAALTDVPADLATMDEAGLKAELAKATEQHTKDIADEVQAVRAAQADQRAQVVRDVKDLHEALANEAPIFMAIGSDANKAADGALWKIDGVKEASAKIGKGYGKLLSGLGNEAALAENPRALAGVIDGLQRQQAGLELVRAKLPQITEALGDRAQFMRGLPYVDEALEQTKGQIAKLKVLSERVDPRSVSRVLLDEQGNGAFPERLVKLASGEGDRVQAVRAAQQALKDGRELGVVGSRARSAAETVGAGLAHFVPGGALAAHWMGEQAGNLVEWAARRLRGVATKTADATAGHVKTFLETAAKVGRAAKAPAVTLASETLGRTRFGASDEAPAPKTSSLGDLFNARSAELRAQTEYGPTGAVQVRPEARQRIAAAFDGIRAIAPVLADKLEDVACRRIALQSQALPRRPDTGDAVTFGPDRWKPSDLEIRAWARIVRATEDPESVEKRLAHGTMTPEEAQAYRAVYPERFAAIQRAILAEAPRLERTLPRGKKIALSVFTGVPLVKELQPNVLQVLQATFATEPGTNGGTAPPAPQPSFSKFGSLKDTEKPTAAQARDMRDGP